MSAPVPNNREQVMNDNDFIVSKTDTKGRITYCNEVFMKVSKMEEPQLLGKPHSIVRHPDMPKIVFKLLWNKIQQGEEIFAYVKNLAADGSYYWVFANVTPSYDNNNNIIGYYSVRIKPNPKALDEVIKPLYEKLRALETSGGMAASEAHLNQLLKEKGVSYDEFIVTIQTSY